LVGSQPPISNAPRWCRAGASEWNELHNTAIRRPGLVHRDPKD
jgi:hypothetical protein